MLGACEVIAVTGCTGTGHQYCGLSAESVHSRGTCALRRLRIFSAL